MLGAHRLTTSRQVVYDDHRLIGSVVRLRELVDLILVGYWCAAGDYFESRLGQGLAAHVAPGDSPFVVSFHEHGTDEADDGCSAREDPNDVGAAADLLVQAFLGVIGTDLLPVLVREAADGQEVMKGVCEQGSCLRKLLFELLEYAPVLNFYLLYIELDEDRAIETGDDTLGMFGDTCVSRSLMKCVRQRCHADRGRTAAIASLSPGWASETTNSMPRSPRATSSRRKAVQAAPCSLVNRTRPRTSRWPSALTAVASARTVLTTLPCFRGRRIIASSQRLVSRPLLRGRVRGLPTATLNANCSSLQSR